MLDDRESEEINEEREKVRQRGVEEREEKRGWRRGRAGLESVSR